jgi:acyl-CoA reductase-like NAD-dependent aldehyde dehydrogenase
VQVVKAANDNPYGLASGVLAKDQGIIDSLVRKIRAGTVWVNTYNVYDAGEVVSYCTVPYCTVCCCCAAKHSG